MKFLSVVEEIAEISPMCSTIVASAIGMMAMMDVAIWDVSGERNTSNTVSFILKGSPIQAACLTGSKSTIFRQQAAI